MLEKVFLQMHLGNYLKSIVDLLFDLKCMVRILLKRILLR